MILAFVSSLYFLLVCCFFQRLHWLVYMHRTGRSFLCSCVLIILWAGMSFYWHCIYECLFPWFPFCSSVRSLTVDSTEEDRAYWLAGFTLRCGVDQIISLGFSAPIGKGTKDFRASAYLLLGRVVFSLFPLTYPLYDSRVIFNFAWLLDFYTESHCWIRIRFPPLHR